MGYLSDEYKMLQEKIDKIGAFRVTVKGFSATAVGAGLVAVASGKGFSPLITAFALTVLLGFFFWFEREQNSLQNIFGARARLIEIAIDKRRRRKGPGTFFSSPNIARTVLNAKTQHVLFRRRSDHPLVDRCRRTVNSLYADFRLWLRKNWLYNALNGIDGLFYVALIAVAWLPLFSKPSVLPAAPASAIFNDFRLQEAPPKEPLADTKDADAPPSPKVQNKTRKEPLR